MSHLRIKLIIVIPGKLTEIASDRTKINQADFYQNTWLCYGYYVFDYVIVYICVIHKTICLNILYT
jgi:hypothetical protein